MKTCPDCAESVQDAARVCRYCGYRFAPSDSERGDGTAVDDTGHVGETDPEPEAAADEDFGCACLGCFGFILLVVLAGAIAYFGFGVGRSASDTPENQRAVSARAVTCGDLGLVASEDGKAVPLNKALMRRVTIELGRRALGSSVEPSERVKAMAFALAAACAKADSPSAKPAEEAMRLASGATRATSSAPSDGPSTSSDEDSQEQCIVLGNGNKLCGSDASAWCDANLGSVAGTPGFDACKAVMEATGDW